MSNISNILVKTSAGNTALVTHNINEDTTVDLTNYTTMMVIRSTGEYTITVNDPTKEMQDVLVKNDSIYTIFLVLGSSGSIELVAGSTIKMLPTGTVGGYTWYAIGADGVSFTDYDPLPPPWSVEYKIMASDAESSDRFGISVSMSADGTKCIVGARYEGTGGTSAGAAYIFSWNGTTWSEDQILYASDAQASDYFGKSVSMNADGTKCIVGAYQEDTGGDGAGAAYIFSWGGTAWSEDQKIMASDAESSDYFGNSVSMSVDGTKVIVGAYGETTGGSQAGAAYIFSLDGTWSEDQKIQASDKEALDYFGKSVSMNADGTKVIVGATREDTGGNSAGAAYIFSLDGTWSEDQKIMASDAESLDTFGRDVSMSADGTKVIVGAYGEDTGGSQAGAAYIFSLDGTWSEDQKIQASDKEALDYFGESVSMNADGTKVIVGAYGEDTGESSAGAAYIFSLDGTWIEDQILYASDAEASDNFGYSVSMSGDGIRVIVGAYGEDTGGDGAGAAYIY